MALVQEKLAYNHALCVYPHLEGSPEKKYCPPIGLEYIAKALEKNVKQVTIVDMRFEPNLDIFLKEGDIDLVCLSLNWEYQLQATLDIIARLPEGITIIVGGRHATACVEELFRLAPRLDIIIRGDGEEIVRDIVCGLPLVETSGLSFRQGNKIIHNKARELTSLDDALYPDRSLRRVNYRVLYKEIDLGLGIDFISTSRGCPYTCKFCTFTNNPLGQKRGWSARSARSVVDELKTIEAKFIFVVDDNFAVDMKRVEEICDLIIAEGIKKTFAVALRLEVYKHPAVLKKMFKAGFKILTIGIESAQDKTLQSMQKGFDTAKALEAFSQIHKVNFYIHGYFIIGCIGESEEEMLAIASFAKRLKLDTINLSLLRTEKYSPLNEVVANSRDYYVDKDNMVCSKNYSLSKLKKIRHQVSKGYYNSFTMFRIAKKIFTAQLISFPHLLKLASVLCIKKSTNKD